MPSLTPSQRGHSPGAARCIWRGSWAQITLQTLVLVLVFTTKYGEARPAIMDYISTDDFSLRADDPSQLQGIDLRILCSRTQSFELRVLCRLTQPGDSWSAPEGRKRLVNKRSDASSLSAFQRIVAQLRDSAADRAEASQRLQQLKAMGIIDENNNVISVPDEERSLMAQLG